MSNCTCQKAFLTSQRLLATLIWCLPLIVIEQALKLYSAFLDPYISLVSQKASWLPQCLKFIPLRTCDMKVKNPKPLNRCRLGTLPCVTYRPLFPMLSHNLSMFAWTSSSSPGDHYPILALEEMGLTTAPLDSNLNLCTLVISTFNHSPISCK